VHPRPFVDLADLPREHLSGVLPVPPFKQGLHPRSVARISGRHAQEGADELHALRPALDYLESVLALPRDVILPERQYAIGKDLKPCDWFDKEVWCRGIIDVLILKGDKAYALDWKTGKRKEGSKQLRLFALMVFLHHPEIQSVKTGFVWLKEGLSDYETFYRREEADLWQSFVGDLAKYNAAFKADVWTPRKSGLCRGWCPVTGCEFWEPKRVK